jgi:hypothetical protein
MTTFQYQRDKSTSDQLEADFAAKEKRYLTQFSETKSTIANLRLEVKTGNDTIQSLKHLLDKEKSSHKHSVASLANEKEKVSINLEEQYSGSIQRQQGLIERLLEDKKE